jgi:hypothetical protein
VFSCLTAFLWRAGLLGIVLAGSRGAAKDVHGGFAKMILLLTQAFTFWTTVLLTVCYVDSTLGWQLAPCRIEQLNRALPPALCTLAMVGFFVAAWVYLIASRPAAVANRPDEKSKWNEKAASEEIRAVWTGWFKRCEGGENTNGRVLRAWASTLALCAGVCLMSICVEAEAEAGQDCSRQQAGPRRVDAMPDVTGLVSSPASQSHSIRFLQLGFGARIGRIEALDADGGGAVHRAVRLAGPAADAQVAVHVGLLEFNRSSLFVLDNEGPQNLDCLVRRGA